MVILRRCKQALHGGFAIRTYSGDPLADTQEHPSQQRFPSLLGNVSLAAVTDLHCSISKKRYNVDVIRSRETAQYCEQVGVLPGLVTAADSDGPVQLQDACCHVRSISMPSKYMQPAS